MRRSTQSGGAAKAMPLRRSNNPRLPGKGGYDLYVKYGCLAAVLIFAQMISWICISLSFELVGASLEYPSSRSIQESILQWKKTVNYAFWVSAAVTVAGLIVLFLLIVRPVHRLSRTALSYRLIAKRRLKASNKSEVETLRESFQEILLEIKKKEQSLDRTKSEMSAQLEANKALEQQLRNTDRLAKAAINTKSAFLAHMSHELRTPLTGISGLAEMMLLKVYGDLGDPRYEGYLEDILNCAQGLLRNVEEILEASSLHIEKTVVCPLHVDITTLIEQAAEQATEALREKNIKLRYEPAPHLPMVWADKNCMEQILDNVIGNAIKYSAPDSSVYIAVAMAGGRRIKIAISDYGTGMSAEEQAAALEFFGIVDAMHANQKRGLGLGLSMSKRLIEIQGGEFDIQSSPGQGTTVTIFLPCKVSPRKSAA